MIPLLPCVLIREGCAGPHKIALGTSSQFLALSGIASILFAAILLWDPAAGAVGLLWFIASYAIALGIFLILLGFKVRSLRGELRRAEA